MLVSMICLFYGSDPTQFILFYYILTLLHSSKFAPALIKKLLTTYTLNFCKSFLIRSSIIFCILKVVFNENHESLGRWHSLCIGPKPWRLLSLIFLFDVVVNVQYFRFR